MQQSGLERSQQFAVTPNRAGNLTALHGAPDPCIHPGHDGGVEIPLQEVDIADAAPAAAGNVDAVGALLAFEIGLPRQIVFDRDWQPAYFRVTFDAERMCG